MDHAIVNLLRWFDAPGALVFCSTREAVRRLHGSLVERGFAAVALSGELSQSERTHALQALRDGRARVCVATDVAARGLDLPDLSLVIHFDLPATREALTHRSGRTGRAGRKGVSVVMVPFTRRRRAEQLLASAHVEAAWGAPPTADEIRVRDQERLLADPVFAEEPLDGDAALVAKLLSERTPDEIAAALIRMYRARLPSAEELFEETPAHLQREERERPNYRSSEGGVWFRLTIGRRNNADPKWLIPLICRLGHVTKKEIGSIRIFEKETRFEIAADTAVRFAATVKDAAEKDARIEPSVAPDAGERPTRPKHIPGPRRGPPRGDGPPRTYGDKPARARDDAPAPRAYAAKPAHADKPAAARAYGDKPPRAPKGEGGPPRAYGAKPVGGDDRPKRKPKR
jgi:ATP-dependent RNA helicase DeaD